MGGYLPEKICDAKCFQSMSFLENSLTGIERVIPRGEGLWENIYFLDPPPKSDEGDDEVGDTEFRNGRPTLLFAGSGTSAAELPKDGG